MGMQATAAVSAVISWLRHRSQKYALAGEVLQTIEGNAFAGPPGKTSSNALPVNACTQVCRRSNFSSSWRLPIDGSEVACIEVEAKEEEGEEGGWDQAEMREGCDWGGTATPSSAAMAGGAKAEGQVEGEGGMEASKMKAGAGRGEGAV